MEELKDLQIKWTSYSIRLNQRIRQHMITTTKTFDLVHDIHYLGGKYNAEITINRIKQLIDENDVIIKLYDELCEVEEKIYKIKYINKYKNKQKCKVEKEYMQADQEGQEQDD